mgnify:CR=1 FL=1
MPTTSGGHIIFNGEEILLGSSRFAELMPITNAMLREIQIGDDITNVTTALAAAVMKLELELRSLRSETDPN